MASFDQMVVIRKPTVAIENSTMQLKDFLVEDQSSCSSSGFKSFPRKRQCCTTVRFLLEIDLKQRDIQIPSIINDLNGNGSALGRSRSKTASSVKASILQRASNAVINAVKHLPYRKLLVKTRFWGSSRKGGPRLTLAADRCGPSDREVEFGNSEKSLLSFSSGVQNDMSFQKAAVETTVGEDSGSEGGSTIAKDWQNEEEKEQFSPVSILDCPFEDDDQISSPNFHPKVAREVGTKQRNLQKIRRFENLSHLEPVDLEKRIATSELEENEHPDERGEKAKELMRRFKSKNKGYMGSKANNSLVFDYIKELMVDEESSKNNAIDNEREVFKVMEDWLKGETREVLLGWEVKEGRKAYVKDMERGGKWKRFDDEIQEVGLYLEDNILDSLMHEILLDIL